MPEQLRKFNVLLVEDNPADARLIREAFNAIDANISLLIADTGAEALALLRRECPDFILLDLNLPAVDGREVLEVLKGDKRRRHIPIVVLTSSAMPQDVVSAYGSGANCYVQKPMDLESFQTKIKELFHFWTETAVLPPSN